MKFKYIAKFKFNGKTFCMFKNQQRKIAFLELRQDKYYYPTLEDYISLVKMYTSNDEDKFFINFGDKKYRFVPKIKHKAGLLLLTSSLISTILTGCGNPTSTLDYGKSFAYSEYYTEVESEIEVESETEAEIDNESDNPYINQDCYETEDYDVTISSKYVKFYNNKYFDEVFGTENVPLNDVIDNINSNKKISDFYQKFLITTCTDFNNFYDDLDLRVFNYNVIDLKFEFRPADAIKMTTNSVAYYDKETNTIVLSEDIDFNNIRDVITLRHEIGHIFNVLNTTKKEWTIKYNFNDAGYGRYSMESMNVIFTTLPYMDEYEGEDNLGYPITANEISIIINSLPDYNVIDSINNNVYHFEESLNEYMPEYDAERIISLMDLQWKDYCSDELEVSEEDYQYLFSFIAKIYMKSNLNSEMTYTEIMEQQDSLKEQLLKGIPEERQRYIYEDVITEEFANYLNLNNIESSTLKH